MENKLAYHLLWERIRMSDRDAFFDLYKAFYYQLVNYGIKICADSELSAEAADAVFTTIWQKSATLNRVDNVESYLLVFFKRKLFRLLERKKKLSMAMQNAGIEGEWNEMGYEEFIIKVQTDEILKLQLKQAFGKLTIRQRELIYLKFFEGLSYEAISEKTGQTVKTAYNTIYDGLKILRRELQ